LVLATKNTKNQQTSLPREAQSNAPASASQRLRVYVDVSQKSQRSGQACPVSNSALFTPERTHSICPRKSLRTSHRCGTAVDAYAAVDRNLEANVMRRNRIRRIAGIALPLLAIASLIVALPAWIRPSVTRARIRTAVVTVGPIEAVITAAGLVVPELERVLSSPLDARVLKVLRRPGSAVQQGDPVVELDVNESILRLEKIVTDLKIKDNEQAQSRLALEKSLADIDKRIERTTLELQVAETKVKGAQQLSSEGLISVEALRELELAASRERIALRQLTDERASAERTTRLQSEGLSLQRGGLSRDADEARRLLDLALTKSDREGVVTWVTPQEGALVRRGDVIARIADLSSFRVDGSVSDVHAGRVRPGAPVIVQIGKSQLSGSIADVFPTVENGIIRFTATLDDRSNRSLRPNLRADVLIVTDRRARTLRVKRGPFADGAGERYAFALHGSRAVRTGIELGLLGFDEVEVTRGLREGDEIVISDMRDYAHLSEIRVR
jgi:HlyD family secretion protein